MLTIPRFGSTRHTDADYDPVLARIFRRLLVRVNGVAAYGLIAYNIDEGWARVFRCNLGPGNPHPVTRGARVVEETLVGRVTVRWR